MTITYQWKITGLKKQADVNNQIDDVIVQTYWECIGTNEDGVTGIFVGATPFNLDTVDPNNFVEYSNLTEQQVIGWIEDVVYKETSYWDHISGRIEKEINSKIAPINNVSNDELPWSK